jgi:hypothetical protein
MPTPNPLLKHCRRKAPLYPPLPLRALHNKIEIQCRPQRGSSGRRHRDRPAREGQCGVDSTPPVHGVRARVAPLSTSHQHARPPHSTLCLGGCLNILLWRRLSAWPKAGDTGAQWRRLARAPCEHPRHSGWAPSGSAAFWDAELCSEPPEARPPEEPSWGAAMSFGHV